MSEAMDDDVFAEVCKKPFVQCIGRRVGITAAFVSVPWEGKSITRGFLFGSQRILLVIIFTHEADSIHFDSLCGAFRRSAIGAGF